MRKISATIFVFILLLTVHFSVSAQLIITTNSVASELAQRIAGEGVLIKNAKLTGSPSMTAFFLNKGGNKIGIDSGIVLTNGRAKTAFNPVTNTPTSWGLDGNSSTSAVSVVASSSWGLPGDADLAAAIGVPTSAGKDACILEFDFVPQGEKVSFKYVMSSEEYNKSYVCSYNDAFAFFISGPGILGKKNIALIPNTNTPVSITNINDVAGSNCPNNTQYFVDSRSNTSLMHDGHTTLLSAEAEVQSCQTYHLKLVIMDMNDDEYDSGVFLQAKSLTSEPLKINNQNPLNDLNQPYIAEGCNSGAIHITRAAKKPYPQTVTLAFGGTAVNGVDVTALPSAVTIPANDSVFILPITAIADLANEGNELLKIYISAGCAGNYADSIDVQIRDYDLLSIAPADSIAVCRNSTIQLQAQTGFTTYTWTGAAGLSDPSSANPLATPINPASYYICTARKANCIAKDSVLIKWKMVELESKKDIDCKDGLTGELLVKTTNWEIPVEYSLDGKPFNISGIMHGLAAGTHQVRVRDGSGCMDSLSVDLVQVYPDLKVTLSQTAATCNLTPDGTVTATASGGNGVYTYSLTNNSYQGNNLFTTPHGNQEVYVKDGNGCTAKNTVTVDLDNSIVIDAGDATTICEGDAHTINASSNATAFNWSSAATLNNASALQPIAMPSDTTRYYITATLGVCTKIDSVDISVRPAPVPDAGNDIAVCYGKTITLEGNGGVDFAWSPATNVVSGTNNAQLDIKGLQTITYYLHVTDANGCHSLTPDAIQVKVTPPLELFAGNDTIITPNSSIRLSAKDINNSGVTQWSWSPATNLDNASVQSPAASFSSPVLTPPYEYVYTLTGTTPEGCEGKDEIRIKVILGPEIYVPSGFTPNNDGKNDILKPVITGIKELRFFNIYNRWGQLIFSTKDASRGWDGRMKGTQESNATYVWIAEGIDHDGKVISRKGTVTLVR